jgi:DNA uptake protein ComE-like DNA-binding protein
MSDSDVCIQIQTSKQMTEQTPDQIIEQTVETTEQIIETSLKELSIDMKVSQNSQDTQDILTHSQTPSSETSKEVTTTSPKKPKRVPKDEFSDSNNPSDKKLADLNYVSAEELMMIDRVGIATANRIIKNRPYKSFEDFEERSIVGKIIAERLKKCFGVYDTDSISIKSTIKEESHTEARVPQKESQCVGNKIESNEKPRQISYDENYRNFNRFSDQEFDPEKSLIVPKALRFSVWKTYASSTHLDAKCYCCRKNPISADNFICGHVKSRKKGGHLTLENLRPICASCNNSMGSQHMFEFIEKYKLWHSGTDEPIEWNREDEINDKEMISDKLFRIYEKLDSKAKGEWIKKLHNMCDDITQYDLQTDEEIEETITEIIKSTISEFLNCYYFDIVKKLTENTTFKYSGFQFMEIELNVKHSNLFVGKGFNSVEKKIGKFFLEKGSMNRPVNVEYNIYYYSTTICALDISIENDKGEFDNYIDNLLENKHKTYETVKYDSIVKDFQDNILVINNIGHLINKSFESNKSRLAKYEFLLNYPYHLREKILSKLDSLVAMFDEIITYMNDTITRCDPVKIKTTTTYQKGLYCIYVDSFRV